MERIAGLLMVLAVAGLSYWALRWFLRVFSDHAEHYIRALLRRLSPGGESFNEARHVAHEEGRRVASLSTAGAGILLCTSVAAFAAALNLDQTGSLVVVRSASEILQDPIGVGFLSRLAFTAEQAVNGIAFDFFESFGLRLTDIRYDAADAITASAVFIVRGLSQLYLTLLLAGWVVQRTWLQNIDQIEEVARPLQDMMVGRP